MSQSTATAYQKSLPPRRGKVRMGVKSQTASTIIFNTYPSLDGGRIEPAPAKAEDGCEACIKSNVESDTNAYQQHSNKKGQVIVPAP